MIGIYKITNTINGKSYIGQSINIEKRFKYHKTRCQNRYLKAAMQKHGIDSFIFETVKEIHPGPLQYILLDCYEEYYIKLFNTIQRDCGYNLMHGGQPGRLCEESLELLKRNCAGKLKGHKKSPQTIENMRRAQRNRPDEVKRKISESSKGKVISQEQREKIRKTLTGRHLPNEVKEKVSRSLKGKKKTPEHIEKVANAFKKWLETPDGIIYRKKQSEKMRGNKIALETREKMSASAKKRKASDDTRKKISEAHMGRKLTEEHKEKLRLAMKKRIESGEINKPRKPLSGETKAKISQKMKEYYRLLNNKEHDT